MGEAFILLLTIVNTVILVMLGLSHVRLMERLDKILRKKKTKEQKVTPPPGGIY